MPISERAARAFLKSIAERPEDFEMDEYVLKDKRSGVEWWIANGGSFFDLYARGFSKTYTMIDFLFWPFMWRGKCWRAVNSWRRNNPMLDTRHAAMCAAEKRAIEAVEGVTQ